VNFNFHLGYCRDTGLPDFNLSVIKGVTGDIQKQFLFKQNSPGEIDAIGLRIYTNTTFASPLAWYKEAFPFESGTPTQRTVDSYQAVQNGRTTYVAGTNLDAASILATKIFVLSYNNDASDSTRAIAEQMLNRIRTNLNIGPDDKTQITRDTKRMADLQDTTIALTKYNAEHGGYPSLEAGTFLRSMSTSRWPSWEATLGNALGTVLSEDPINTFSSCPAGYNDQNACWNEPTKTFRCEAGSHIYAYRVEGHCSTTTGTACFATDQCPAGEQCLQTTVHLYSNLEYSGPGKWSTGAVGDPCSFDVAGGSQCACFNYRS
jgi:hypothetical protein